MEIHQICKHELLTSRFRKLPYDRHTHRQRSYEWSRYKDGGHTIRSATPKHTMLHTNLMAVSFIELDLWATKVYIAGIKIFNLFCSCDLEPMTFIYKLDPYSQEIHQMCNMNVLRQVFRKKVIV